MRVPINPWKTLLVTSLLVLLASGASAGDFDIDITCPASENSGDQVVATVTLTNEECFPVTARVMTSIVGNGNNTLGGFGVYGPVVTNPVVAVPAAVDLFPPGCFSVAAGSTTFALTTAPALDASLEGSVATVLVIAEFEGGESTVFTECLVEVVP